MIQKFHKFNESVKDIYKIGDIVKIDTRFMEPYLYDYMIQYFEKYCIGKIVDKKVYSNNFTENPYFEYEVEFVDFDDSLRNGYIGKFTTYFYDDRIVCSIDLNDFDDVSDFLIKYPEDGDNLWKILDEEQKEKYKVLFRSSRSGLWSFKEFNESKVPDFIESEIRFIVHEAFEDVEDEIVYSVEEFEYKTIKYDDGIHNYIKFTIIVNESEEGEYYDNELEDKLNLISSLLMKTDYGNNVMHGMTGSITEGETVWCDFSLGIKPDFSRSFKTGLWDFKNELKEDDFLFEEIKGILKPQIDKTINGIGYCEFSEWIRYKNSHTHASFTINIINHTDVNDHPLTKIDKAEWIEIKDSIKKIIHKTNKLLSDYISSVYITVDGPFIGVKNAITFNVDIEFNENFKRSIKTGLWDLKIEGLDHEYTADTPLIVACGNGDYDQVEYLIKNGADVNEGNLNKTTPLMRAAFYGFIRIAELLIKHHAKINIFNVNNFNPLRFAVQLCWHNQSKSLEMVKFLVENGADITLKKNGRSAIEEASICYADDIVEYFVEEILKNHPEKIHEIKKYITDEQRIKYKKILRQYNTGLWNLKKESYIVDTPRGGLRNFLNFDEAFDELYKVILFMIDNNCSFNISKSFDNIYLLCNGKRKKFLNWYHETRKGTISVPNSKYGPTTSETSNKSYNKLFEIFIDIMGTEAHTEYGYNDVDDFWMNMIEKGDLPKDKILKYIIKNDLHIVRKWRGGTFGYSDGWILLNNLGDLIIKEHPEELPEVIPFLNDKHKKKHAHLLRSLKTGLWNLKRENLGFTGHEPPDFKVGDIVECINNDCVEEYITIGNYYEVLGKESYGTYFYYILIKIISDKGKEVNISSRKFKYPDHIKRAKKSGLLGFKDFKEY